MKNKIILSALSIIVASVAFTGCDSSNGNTANSAATTDKKASPQILTCSPTLSDMAKSITLPGELKAFNQVDIYAKESGFVKQVLVDRGSVVKKGDLLAVLDAPELAAQMAEAESKLNAEQAIYIASKSNYKRLFETSQIKGTVSVNDLEQMKSKMIADSAMVVSAKSAYQSLSDIQNYLNVTAPFDGIITERNISPGALVGVSRKNNTLPMFSLKQENKLRLVVAVPEIYASSIPDKQNVFFSVDAFPGKKFIAVLARKADAITQDIRSEMIEFDVDNSNFILESGMYAELNLQIQRADSSLFVPKSAVVTSTERVFVIQEDENGKAKWVDVKKGNESGDKVEIWGNVKPADVLVLNASDQLREGQEIK
ncbi:MAG: efflux RND transporter periplasmic adaptor subunit [Bacteroidia bacterium]